MKLRHPDNAGRYSEKQEMWNKFSEGAIATATQMIEQGQNFEDIYTVLAQQRQEIAKQLGHGIKDGRGGDYGTFRLNRGLEEGTYDVRPMDMATELFFFSDKK